MAKAAQLVCQHLENISRDALEKYLPIIRRYVVRRQEYTHCIGAESFITSDWLVISAGA